MTKISKAKLNKILKAHKLWLKDPTKGCRANLSEACLSGADLSYGVNLRVADLSGADLNGG